jgi:hypothetical protein
MDPVSLTVALASLVFSGIALVVTFLQYGLAETQTSVARRQAQIAEEQHAISKLQHELLLREVALRPALFVSAGHSNVRTGPEDGDFQRSYVMTVHNSGKTPARDVYFEVVMTVERRSKLEWSFDRSAVENGVHGGGRGEEVVYSGNLVKPLMPGDSVIVLNASRETVRDTQPKALWRVYSPHGNFPEDGSFAELNLSWMLEDANEANQS